MESKHRQRAIAIDVEGRDQIATVIVDSCKDVRRLPPGRHEGTMLEKVRLSSRMKDEIPKGGEVWRAIPDLAEPETSQAANPAKQVRALLFLQVLWAIDCMAYAHGTLYPD